MVGRPFQPKFELDIYFQFTPRSNDVFTHTRTHMHTGPISCRMWSHQQS